MTISDIQIAGQHIRSEFLGVGLTDDEINRFARLARPTSAPPGKMIFGKGDPGNGFMILISGVIVIRSYSADGKEVILNIITPSEIFGEMTLADGAPRSAEASATKHAEYLFFDRHAVIGFMQTCPRLALNFLEQFGRRCRALSDELEQSAFLDLERRLARKLVAYMENFGETREGDTIRISVTQSELGSMLGTSRESINKHLQKWAKSGEVVAGRGHLDFCNPEFIRRIANEVM